MLKIKDSLGFLTHRSSIVTLLLSNLLPLAGVLFWGWKIESILLLYWSESGIIGFFNVLKMALSKGKTISGTSRVSNIVFFCLHYGIFMAVHGSFLFIIMSGKFTSPGRISAPYSIPNLFEGIWVALASVFLSHAYSFITNFIGQGEYKTANINTLFLKPYGRIVIMHFTVLVGAFISTVLGNPIGMLLLLIGLKTVTDYFGHAAEHFKGKAIVSISIPGVNAVQDGNGLILTTRKKSTFQILLFVIFAGIVFGIGVTAYRFASATRDAFPENALTNKPYLSDYREYTDNSLGFRFFYPETWAVSKNPIYDDDGKTLLAEDIVISKTDLGQALSAITIRTMEKDNACEGIKAAMRTTDWVESQTSINGEAATAYEPEDMPAYQVYQQTVVLPAAGGCIQFDLYSQLESPGIGEMQTILQSFRQ